MGKNILVYKFDRDLYSTKEGLDKILNVINKYKEKKLVVVASQNHELEKNLEELIVLAVSRKEILWSGMEKLKSDQLALARGIISPDQRHILEADIRLNFQNMEEVLKSVWLVGECSDITREYVIGLGNLWITQMLCEYFISRGFSAGRINSKEILEVEREDSGITIQMEFSYKKLTAFLKQNEQIDVFFATGGRGTTRDGKSLSLGLYGIEVTASVYANLLVAEELVFWTTSDGVKSADPDKVPAAVTIPSLSYAEATELAYFGAKTLHPAAYTYAMHKKIPIRIRSIDNLDSEGTSISHLSGDSWNSLIKGFSIVDNISLLNIEGSGMVGVPGISSRLFSALHKKGISVITISQASSEHSICCGVSSDQAV